MIRTCSKPYLQVLRTGLIKFSEYQVNGFVDDDKADLTIKDQHTIIDDEVDSGFQSIKAKLFAESGMKASQTSD